jgi:hypothetical protein
LLPSSSLTAPLCWCRLPCWYLLQPKLGHNPKLSLRQLGSALCRRWDHWALPRWAQDQPLRSALRGLAGCTGPNSAQISQKSHF